MTPLTPQPTSPRRLTGAGDPGDTPTAAEFAAADVLRRCLELDGRKWTDKARDDWARIIAAHRTRQPADPAQEPIVILSRNEMLSMVAAMKKYGGSFVQALSECFIASAGWSRIWSTLADRENLARLYATFPEYVKEYHELAQSDAQRAVSTKVCKYCGTPENSPNYAYHLCIPEEERTA